MAVFKCKMCGGTLDVNNETVAVCEYCGTKQTISKSKYIENQSTNKFFKKKKYCLCFAHPTFIKILYLISLVISSLCGIYFFVTAFLEGNISLLFEIEAVLNFFLLIIGFVSFAPLFILKKKIKTIIVPILLQGITVVVSFIWVSEWISLGGLKITICIITNFTIQIIWFLVVCFSKKEEIK